MSEFGESVTVRYRRGLTIRTVLGIGAALMVALLLGLTFLFLGNDRVRYDDLSADVRASQAETSMVLTAIGMRMNVTGEESGRIMDPSLGMPQMDPSQTLSAGTLALQYTVDQLWERYDRSDAESRNGIMELSYIAKPLTWTTLYAILAGSALSLIVAFSLFVQSVRLRTGEGFIKEGE